MGRLCNSCLLLRRHEFSSHIGNIRNVNIAGFIAVLILLVITIFTVSPLYFVSFDAEATAKDSVPSTLAFTVNRDTASVSLNVTNKNGSFATSDEIETVAYAIRTSNATGYTLSLRVDDGGSASLVDSTNNDSNTNTITSISDVTSYTSFSGNDTSAQALNNKWGIIPSKYNSANNTVNYYPATTSGFIIDETDTANNEVINRYTVGLGVRADFSVLAGTYTNNTLIAELVANPVTYSISYSKNANVTTITGMPSPNPQTGTISQGTTATSVTLASAPSRTGYTFIGWCLGTSSSSNVTTTDGVDICGNASTNQFEAGQSFGINATGTSPDTYYLYAMWSANSYACTKQYRLENADGSWGEYIEDGIEQVKYGSTCSYSKTIANYKGSVDAGNNSTAATSGTMSEDGLLLSLSLFRNTYTCKIGYRYQNTNDTYTSVTSAVDAVKRYGEACSWSTAEITGFDSTTYQSANYTNNSISADVNTTVSIKRNTVTVTKQYRLQNTNGSYPASYTADGTETVLYGASYTYSRAATTSHLAASDSVSNVTTDATISLDVPRRTYTITKQYKLQDTSGNYPNSYIADGTETVLYGASYTYSRAATTSHLAASDSVSNVTTDATISLDVPRRTYTCTKQYRLQNADTTFPSTYTPDGSVTAYHGGSCSYSKSVADYRGAVDATNGAQGSASATNVTADQTLSISFYRNAYTLTVTAGANTSNATGAGSKIWGQTVAVGVTKNADTTCVSYAAPTWTASVGTAPAAGVSSTYTMPKSNATVTAVSVASDISQTVTLSRSSDTTSINIAGTDYTGSSVSLKCGTYNISGNYATGHEFSSWSRANGVTVANISADSTTMTVSGAGTLTLNGKTSTYSLVVTFAGTGVSSVQVRTASGTGGSLVGTVSSSGGSVSGLAYDTAYYLYPVFAESAMFSSWEKTSSAGTLSSTTATNPTFTMGVGDGAVKITGVSKNITNQTYLQDVMSCDSSVANYTLFSISDFRDGKSYKAMRVPKDFSDPDGDAYCVMSSLDIAGGTLLDNTTSNVASSYTLPTSSRSGFSNNNTAYVYNSGNTNCDSGQYGCYSYYSYTAATAGTGGTSMTSGETQYDICPKGWRMAKSTEMVGLYNAVVAYEAGHSRVDYWGHKCMGHYDNGNIVEECETVCNDLSCTTGTLTKDLYGTTWTSSVRDSSSSFTAGVNYTFNTAVPQSAIYLGALGYDDKALGYQIHCILND